MIRDRDGCYGQAVTKRLPDPPEVTLARGTPLRIEPINLSACPFYEAHLRWILAAYGSYYNELRTHLSLSNASPCHRPVQRLGQLVAQPILGSLHHRYCRI